VVTRSAAEETPASDNAILPALLATDSSLSAAVGATSPRLRVALAAASAAALAFSISCTNCAVFASNFSVTSPLAIGCRSFLHNHRLEAAQFHRRGGGIQGRLIDRQSQERADQFRIQQSQERYFGNAHAVIDRQRLRRPCKRPLQRQNAACPAA